MINKQNIDSYISSEVDNITDFVDCDEDEFNNNCGKEADYNFYLEWIEEDGKEIVKEFKKSDIANFQEFIYTYFKKKFIEWRVK